MEYLLEEGHIVGYVIAWFFLIYMGIVILVYTGQLLLALFHLRKERKLYKKAIYEDYLEINYTKPVSILVPAYNEQEGITETVRSLLSLKYPLYEIVVINDGSTDETVDRLLKEFHMISQENEYHSTIETAEIKQMYRSTVFPNIILIDKYNGGKADALNAGLNVSNYPYVCSIDADSILENDALLKVMKPIILSGTDEDEVIASGGNIRIANGSEIQLGAVLSKKLSKNPLVVMQVIEYLRAFLMGRIGLSQRNLILIISGAFSVFSKSWVMKIGGYSTKTVGEDMELIVRLHRYVYNNKLKKRIMFVPDPVCWTEAPESMKYLRRQRSRWHRGLLESLWTHRRMTLNPKYKGIGLVAFPYFWLIEFFGPIIELIGYSYMVFSFFLGGIFLEFAVVFFLLFLLHGTIFSITAVILDGWTLNQYPHFSDLVLLFIYSLTEIFWYRPLTVLWRCSGLIQMLVSRTSHSWGEMKRKGIAKIKE